PPVPLRCTYGQPWRRRQSYTNKQPGPLGGGRSIGRYLGFYNARRPHSSLGGRPPDQTYFDNLPQAVAA
ncbi:MAG: hypothetical protein E2586_23100, partial [Novosphingobium sp.]|nr:hypothetical protein [Novosphingobium sp.]